MANAAVARRLEQHEGAEDVGLDELARRVDRAVDVGLRGEVDDRIAALDRGRHGVAVGDVAHGQLNPVRGQALEVLAAARVGQLVEHANGVLRVRIEAPSNVCGADEAGATGH